MASSPLIFEAMPPLAARRRPALFALLSILKCREEPGRMSPLGPKRQLGDDCSSAAVVGKADGGVKFYWNGSAAASIS